MMEYILEYMEKCGQLADSATEEQKLEEGILLYLEENGISPAETRKYFYRYVNAHLALIDATDLKAYFVEYPTISKVKQIAIEKKCDGKVEQIRVAELYELIRELHSSGLGEKYVPAVEIREILGQFS